MGRIAFHPLGPGVWTITSPWRPSWRPGHRGVDLACVRVPLYASVSGRAVVGSEPTGAGWWVNIVSEDGRILTKCFHMSRIDVAHNAQVVAGQQIGVSGGVPGEPGAGSTTGAHLHYEIWEGGVDTNPAPDLQAVADTKPKPVDPPPMPTEPLEAPVTQPAVYRGDDPNDDPNVGAAIYADPGDGRLRRVADTGVLAVLRANHVLPHDPKDPAFETAVDPNTLQGLIDFYNFDPPGTD